MRSVTFDAESSHGLAVPVTWKNQQSDPVISKGSVTRKGRSDDPMGIAGPGSIATGFADSMSLVEGGTIAAVASRSMDRADAFGDKWTIPARYGDYADLAADPDVDIVYVATPQSRHHSDVLLFLEGGKHVLCEKPFALNAQQAQRMVAEARPRGLFLMDAIWSRFLPTYRILVDLIGEGRIGEPLLVEADFGYRMPVDPEHRLFRPELGGGGLLDLGIYPLRIVFAGAGPRRARRGRGFDW